MPKAAQAATAKEQKAAIKAQKAAAKAKIEEGKKALEEKVAAATGQADEAAPQIAFADVVMVPGNTMSKRRPGPSLAGFQEMAKEMAPKR